MKNIELPQFFKIADNLYYYKHKNLCYIGTYKFFEDIDKAVRETIRKCTF